MLVRPCELSSRLSNGGADCGVCFLRCVKNAKISRAIVDADLAYPSFATTGHSAIAAWAFPSSIGHILCMGRNAKVDYPVIGLDSIPVVNITLGPFSECQIPG